MQATCRHHAAGGMLQAKLKSNHCCEITQVQEKCKIFFSKVHFFLFCLEQPQKQNLFLIAH